MRFTYHKNHHGSYVIDDSLEKLPLLFFTDLNATLRCVNELNNISVSKQGLLDLIEKKQGECLRQSQEYGVPKEVIEKSKAKIRILQELYVELDG